jgi:DNA-directed RNA polymerase sigma subunit (sigma70/sigma32)
MSSSFKSYLNEIARYPLLTVEQEIQYGRRIAKMRELQQLERTLTNAEQRVIRSGQRARERFMQCNLQLVVHVAKKYETRKRKSLEIMDLIQEGNIGLARAVELFDPLREPMTWAEIAAKIGTSSERVRQIERAAMFRLRMMLNKGRELNGTPLGSYNH